MAKIRAGFLLFLICSATSYAATIIVSNGDNLANKINGAAGGDTVLVNNGTYGAFQISNRNFTEALPLIIKAAPGARPLIQSSDWYQAPITSSSYIVLDGLTFDGGGQPVYCTDVNHLILINLEVRNTGGEAVHIRGTSLYVDIINCHIHHTGSTQPQWAEGIYIGSGSLPFMNEEYVWIECNDIHHTGYSEAINIKSQSYHITTRGNKLHDISPGTTTQYNQAALSLEAADLSFKPGVDTDIWIENNEIYNVTFGQWANGIQTTTMGPRIKNNYIHSCAEYGIYFNSYNDGPGRFTNVLYSNRIENCGSGVTNATTLPWVAQDPGANPNRPQAWYQSDTDTDGDGMTDVDEVRAGTDPNNPASVLIMYAPSMVSGGFVVQWQSATNRWYTLWVATNLLTGFSEIEASHIPATPPMNTFTGSVRQAGSAYYRIALDP